MRLATDESRIHSRTEVELSVQPLAQGSDPLPAQSLIASRAISHVIWQMLHWLAAPEQYGVRRDASGMFHVKHLDDLPAGARIISVPLTAAAPHGTTEGLLARPIRAVLSQDGNAGGDNKSDNSSNAHDGFSQLPTATV